jgi:hypothetical protein
MGTLRLHLPRLLGPSVNMPKLVLDLMERTMPVTESGCIIWMGSVSDNGYGSLRRKGKHMAAHRAVWIQHFGPIPDGQWVLHRCDVRCCVNPDHLFLGTRTDNVRDMVSKNRHNPRAVGCAHIRKNGRWQAKVSVGGITRYVGTYATQEEATEVYWRERNRMIAEGSQ